MINLLFPILVLTYMNSCKFKSDPDNLNRTGDQLIYSQSLYQLSYVRQRPHHTPIYGLMLNNAV